MKKKTKKCSQCKKEKFTNDFHKNKSHSDNLATLCKDCCHFNKYNITIEQRQDIFNTQNGCCAICGLKKKLDLDHNHKTGIIRGLLCINCNKTVGYYEKRKEEVEKYLQTVPQRMIKIYKQWLMM